MTIYGLCVCNSLCGGCALRGVRVGLDEIEKNDYNLNISRYISTAIAEAEIDLPAVNVELVTLEKDIKAARDKHNAFLKELGLPALP